MFTNLIESSSHAKEFKRRGSFLLFTTVTYAVLLVVMGVISVYAYDARLEAQTLEIVTLINPQDLVPEVQPQPAAQPQDRPRSGDNRNNESNVAVRIDPMVGVDRPEKVPDNISATPTTNPPIPNGLWRRGNENSNTGVPAGPRITPGGGEKELPGKPVELEEPPPPADPPKPPKVVHKAVITSQALSLPKPNYPPLAKQMGIQGMVSVQVLIDESGRVISAKAVGGSPFLATEAQRAALQARFSPTVLNDQPVKVSGVITYNFQLNR
ncbi:MAG TPA: energy transducer TonB [Pyrinomonadaceae bacterium]|nr:energy transducer TonB [Pyrinomonadaceae bacterium]